MKRTEREQARRMTAYVDELVLHRRMEGSASDPLPSRDQEFERLRDLVQCLSEVEVAVPGGFQESLASRLQASAEPPAPPARRPAGRALVAHLTRMARAANVPRHVLRPALLALAVLAGVLVLSQSMIDVPVVSAQAVLTRSD
ncbi:MAG: hypothetical protein ACRD26_01310, partial [Vicinamibacterales bacterium]